MNPTLRTKTRYSRLDLNYREDKVIHSESASCSDSENTSNASPRHTSKWGIHCRAVAFICFETAFLIFAYYCLFHPIPIQSHPADTLNILPSFNITLTELKAGITAISVVWHAVACLLVGDIISTVRSAEFMAQYHRLGIVKHRTSDRVSTLTSGFVDNVVHILRGSPTRGFCLAFLVMLILMVLGPLGSGTVTVGTITATKKEPIQVTNLTSTIQYSSLAQQRIPVLTGLEREQNISFMYDMSLSSGSDSVLIPWPNMIKGLAEQSTIIYQSDILKFRFQCSWISPSFLHIYSGEDKIVVDTDNGTSLDSIVWDFDPRKANQITLENSKPPFISILFYTQQLSDIQQSVENIALSGVPHVSSTAWIKGSTYNVTAALLQCDHHGSIVPATVTLARKSLMATVLSHNSALIGNISPLGDDVLVTSLHYAIESETNVKQMLLKVSKLTLIDDTSFSQVEREPLPLDEMAENIDLWVKSVGKAFLSGVMENPHDMSNTLVAINTTADFTFPVAALVSNKLFLIVFTVVIGVIVMLLAVLLWMIRDVELSLFNLENLIGLLGSKQ